MSTPPDELPETSQRRWLGPLLFFAFVGSVLAGASAVGTRYRALHGADFMTGAYVDTRFQAPPSVAGGTVAVHTASWPLASGSGSLRVRFETVARGRAKAVIAARVEPGADLVDGVRAVVRVTGYDAVTVDETFVTPIGHVALECVETAADGDHVHRIELRGDGTSYDPDAVR